MKFVPSRYWIPPVSARYYLLMMGVAFSLPVSLFLLNLCFLLLVLHAPFLPNLGNRAKESMRSPVVIGGLLMSLYYMASVFWSENRPEAWHGMELKMQLFLVPFFSSLAADPIRRYPESLTKAFQAGCIVALLLCFNYAFVMQLEHGWNAAAFQYMEFTKAIGIQPIYLSLYTGFCCLMVSGRMFAVVPKEEEENAPALSTGSMVLLGFFLISLVLLNSRTELLVVVFLMAIQYLRFALSKGNVLPKLMRLAVVGLVLAGLVFALPTSRQRFMEMLDFKSSYQENQYGGRAIRIEKWKNTLALAQENIVTGTGLGDMQTKLDAQYRKTGLLLAEQFHFNPHNQYLQVLLVLGLPGLLLFLIWLVVVYRSGVQGMDADFRWFFWLFVLSIVTESMLERQWGISFFCFFVSVLWIRSQSKIESGRTIR